MGLEVDRNRLSHWFPILHGVMDSKYLPKTFIINYPGDDEVSALLDGERPKEWGALLGQVKRAAKLIGYPVFLRHDLFSGKHGWERTCYVQGPNHIEQHIANITEEWHMANWFASGGDDVWIVREYLPIRNPVMHAFVNMPIGRERRCLVRDGKLEDIYPYWPVGALKYSINGDGDIAKVGKISRITEDEVSILTPLAERAGRALGGYWSVDFMETERGWVLIDCALAEQSWQPSLEDRGDWEQAIALSQQ